MDEPAVDRIAVGIIEPDSMTVLLERRNLDVLRLHQRKRPPVRCLRQISTQEDSIVRKVKLKAETLG